MKMLWRPKHFDVDECHCDRISHDDDDDQTSLWSARMRGRAVNEMLPRTLNFCSALRISYVKHDEANYIESIQTIKHSQ
jgi:hypothetical protein